MFRSILRNFKNAGLKVNVALCVQPRADKYDFEPVFSYSDTGLKIHDLGMKAHKELLRQAMASALPPRRGEKFEDIAWMVAASALYRQVPKLRTCSPAEYGMALPYLCFLAEHISKDWKPEEARDVCISRTSEVFINSFAGMNTDSRTLGRYEA